MVDIVAAPELPPLSFGGVFDTLYIGMPAYFWIELLQVVVFCFIMIYVIYVRYWVMDPVWGYSDAVKSKKPVAFLISRTRRMKFVAVRYIAKVFEAIELPYAWLLTSTEAAFSLGGVTTIIVNDDWGIIRNPAIEDAIRILRERYNAEHPTEGERIKTFDSFQNHLMAGDFAQFCRKSGDAVEDGKEYGVELPPFRIVNLWDIRSYLASVDAMDASSHEGFIQSEVQRRLKDERKNDVRPLVYAIAGGSVIIICSILAIVILGMGK